MKKLLVSDYDGTLCPTDESNVTYNNIAAVEQFQSADNKFMLSTGRNFQGIKKQIDHYDIPYDYLSCNDGAVLMDKKNRVLWSNNIKDEDIPNLMDDFAFINMDKKVKLYNAYAETKKMKNVVEIQISTSILPSKIIVNKRNILEFLQKYPYLHLYCDPAMFFIETNGNKTRSIEALTKQESFDKIYTIGDDKNDLEMIKNYNGYKVYSCYPSLYFKNIPTVSSVKSLIKKIS